MAASVPAAARAGSLPSVSSGQRPGPELLYAPPPRAPQLENTGIWKAPPILISGASAYRAGEYIYQDYLYDDHGAGAVAWQPNDQSYNSEIFARPDGTYTYPTAPEYATNAADLVELRVKPLRDATAFRITLNTMLRPDLAATSIAIGESPVPHAFPHGANASAPAQLFLTVHGGSADLLDAATGAAVTPAPTVMVDLERRQIEVRVAHAAWNPGRSVVRLAAGVGLWDAEHGRYLIPQPRSDATHPGGAGALPQAAAFFNVAFRHSEPMPNPSSLSDELANASWWRDAAQAQALRLGDLSPFQDYVDFGKLADRVTDESGVPSTGAMDRILASRFSDGQGADWSAKCGSATLCHGELRGQLQPYAIYVPGAAQPAGGYGLTLLLHSLSSNYNQFLSDRNQSQFGERPPGSLVITPEGRGPDGWYYDWAGADTFEVWNDVARHFHLDPSQTVIAGYSMGGYATWKFATQFPDLFAAAQPTVGPTVLGTLYTGAEPPAAGESTNTLHGVASLRNVPFRVWVATGDELVPISGTLPIVQAMDALGYRYEYDAFAPAEHLTLAINDQFGPAAEWLGDRRVDLNPPHVSYSYNPTMDFPADGTAGGHAYWVSGVQLRDYTGNPPIGTIDVRSLGFGVGDPPASATAAVAGTLPPDNLGVLGYGGQARGWEAASPEPKANRLEITATNVNSVTIDPRRAHVGCTAQLAVATDGPLTVTLAGCGRAQTFGP
jgi:pimeloyl-ACP methyl ester carboxylesterase